MSAATPPSRSRAVSPPHHPATLQAVAGRRPNASTPVLLSSAMSNLARSNSLSAARGRGSRAFSMPPDKHLGLGTMLPDPPEPAPSIKDSSSGSITGKVNAGVSSASCSVAQNEDTVPPNQEANHLSNEEIIALDDEDAEAEGEEVGGTTGKRKKRCTSAVWQYFTKKTVVVEVDGKKYEQLWGYCNFPKCSARYRAESVNGTNAFQSHLRSTHSIVKGQLQLKTERDRGKDVTLVQAFKYDLETSIKKFYLAIIMHEYPFNMVEHEYFVDALKSLRPNFAFKSRVTARKDIMDMYTEEKDKLYDLMKKVPSRFSATMDV
ncbi:Zinc finger BED domain-containing protein DAYSLEEPER [Striga hermonthica]|uniref:Zinc finger BED domain-containing protein DAYSLEEPER n=1 Tax=Striga hermonthica TaxID=68872 RepID=A0A9N7N888_STRHE|nr:Zinc finger BED domain-containing protein DAYSLEEPER [Striga hermonthica]